MEIKIAHLYPELLNLYGDRGNIASLKKRCEWRGIKADITLYGINDEIDFKDKDIVLIGGGAEKEQLLSLDALMKLKDSVSEYIETNGVFLALSSGYHILGKSFEANGKKIDGLALLDFYTINGSKRMISNVVLDTCYGKVPGFENHISKTYTGSLKPFGKVICGFGNNGEDETEGVIYKNLIASNLHGPLLPKNPVVADVLIKNALERKYNKEIALKPLNDDAEMVAHGYIVSKYTKG